MKKYIVQAAFENGSGCLETGYKPASIYVDAVSNEEAIQKAKDQWKNHHGFTKYWIHSKQNS